MLYPLYPTTAEVEAFTIGLKARNTRRDTMNKNYMPYYIAEPLATTTALRRRVNLEPVTVQLASYDPDAVNIFDSETWIVAIPAKEPRFMTTRQLVNELFWLRADARPADIYR